MAIRSLENNASPLRSVDWVVIVLYLLLMAAGWFSVCGASYDFGNTDFFSWESRTGKQLVWMGCSMVLGFVLLMLDDRIFDSIAHILYIGMMALLLITPFVAADIKGSYSWISLGSVSLQPAEFAKCATALMIAKLMGRYGFSLKNKKDFYQAIGVIVLPMVLIIMQRETGSALVYLAFFLMLYREGMPGCFLFAGVAAVIYFVVGVRFSVELLPGSLTPIGEFVVLLLIWIFTLGMALVYGDNRKFCDRQAMVGAGVVAVALIVSEFVIPFDLSWVLIGLCAYTAVCCFFRGLSERLNNYLYIGFFTIASMIFFYSSDYVLNNVLEEHQRTRICVLLGMEQDLTGSGYNVNQSKIAIGSGGLEGKGFLNGTQTKLKYVPEQDTDFIFCTVGEEEGFLGSATVLLLFLTLILRLIYLAERQQTVFGRVYGYSVMSIFLFHVFINVGMVMGLTPVIGIPLPFFSYGGSSLWGFTLLLFIFLRIDAGNNSRVGTN